MDLEKITANIKAKIKEEIEAEGEEYNNVTRGEVMWSLIRALTNKESSPYLRIIDFGEMLSPFSEEFDLILPPEVMKNIRELADTIIKEAKEKDITITPFVRKHLNKIIDGWIPYGYVTCASCEDNNVDI